MSEQEKLESFQDEYKELNASRKTLQKQFDEISSRMTSLEQQDATNIERIKFLKKQQKRLTVNINRMTAANDKAQETIAENEEAMPRLQAEQDSLAEELQSADEELQQLRESVADKVQSIRQMLEEKEKKLMPFIERQNEIRQALEDTNGEIQGSSVSPLSSFFLELCFVYFLQSKRRQRRFKRKQWRANSVWMM